MLDALQNPLVIGVIVVVFVLLIVAIIIRLRRSSSPDILPPPELSRPTDYTALPIEEPTSLADRFRSAAPGTKLLVVVLPLLLIIGAIVLALTFFSGPPAQQATPPPPAPMIANVSARLTGPNRILVQAETNLPDSTEVAAAMKQNGEDFAWFNKDSAASQVRSGAINMTIVRDANAPTPQPEQAYTIVLIATVNNQVVSSAPATLEIPSVLSNGFFGVVAAAPTTAPTIAVTAAATSAPTVAATTPAATPVPSPVPAGPALVLNATVFNGGNIRETPNLNGRVLGQLEASQTVTLLEKTADGNWYRLQAPAATGWSSRTLLTIAPEVAAQVPIEGQAPAVQPTTPPAAAQPTLAATGLTARVSRGGNMRAVPNVQGEVLELVSAGETVQLVAKNAAGNWYLITTPRNAQGWVSASLLSVAAADAAKLPVSDQAISAPPAGATPQPTPQPTTASAPASGLQARVFNGGRIRSSPTIQNSPSNQVGTINANEMVQLLAKSSDGRWYKITDMRGVTGWVSASLLTVPPDVAAKVPVEG